MSPETLWHLTFEGVSICIIAILAFGINRNLNMRFRELISMMEEFLTEARK